MKLWQFVEVEGGKGGWTWRVVATSTGIETASHPHPNYGAAVMDAIRHGFQPGSDQWNVIPADGGARYEPAEKPDKDDRDGTDGTQPSRPLIDGQGTGI